MILKNYQLKLKKIDQKYGVIVLTVAVGIMFLGLYSYPLANQVQEAALKLKQLQLQHQGLVLAQRNAFIKSREAKQEIFGGKDQLQLFLVQLSKYKLKLNSLKSNNKSKGLPHESYQIQLATAKESIGLLLKYLLGSAHISLRSFLYKKNHGVVMEMVFRNDLAKLTQVSGTGYIKQEGWLC